MAVLVLDCAVVFAVLGAAAGLWAVLRFA